MSVGIMLATRAQYRLAALGLLGAMLASGAGCANDSACQDNGDAQALITADTHLGLAPLTVTFDAARSTGPAGQATFAWDFGDGETAGESLVEHTYRQPGVYQVTLDYQLESVTRPSIGVGGEPLEECFIGSAATWVAVVSWEDEVVTLTNQARADNGSLLPLKREPHLDASADGQNSDMVEYDFFDHVNPVTGSDPSTRITAAGYNWSTCGENIAAGQRSPAEVVTAWMNSPGHRANILNTDFQEIGVGYLYDPDDDGQLVFNHYWTQNFGARSLVYPVVINLDNLATVSREVELHLWGADDLDGIAISDTEGTAPQWETPHNTIRWTLPEGYGEHTVYLSQLRGASTTVVTDTIWLVEE